MTEIMTEYEYETLREFKETINFKQVGDTVEGVITNYKTVVTRFNKQIGVITIGNYSIYETAGIKIYELHKYIGRYAVITYTENKYSNKYSKNFKVFTVKLLKEKREP